MTVSLFLFASGRKDLPVFPAVEGTHLYACPDPARGHPGEATSRAVAPLEQAAAENLQGELDAATREGQPSMINHVFSSMGSFIPKGAVSGVSEGAQSNLAEIGIELNMPPGYEGEPASAMANAVARTHRWHSRCRRVVLTSQAFGAGNAIEFELYGKNFDSLRDVAAELRAARVMMAYSYR